jgi:hypothetical protein
MQEAPSILGLDVMFISQTAVTVGDSSNNELLKC